MEDEKDSQSVYCGKCNNRYSKRQNFYEHFKKKSVRSQDKNFPGYIDNVCFNSDIKVCDKDLTTAQKNINHN